MTRSSLPILESSAYRRQARGLGWQGNTNDSNLQARELWLGLRLDWFLCQKGKWEGTHGMLR